MGNTKSMTSWKVIDQTDSRTGESGYAIDTGHGIFWTGKDKGIAELIVRLEKRAGTIERVLGTLIGWIYSSSVGLLSKDEAEELLSKLKKND